MLDTKYTEKQYAFQSLDKDAVYELACVLRGELLQVVKAVEEAK